MNVITVGKFGFGFENNKDRLCFCIGFNLGSKVILGLEKSGLVNAFLNGLYIDGNFNVFFFSIIRLYFSFYLDAVQFSGFFL